VSIIVSQATQSLVIPRNGRTETLFPAAHPLIYQNEDKLIVPHATREYILLRKIGYKVPNPILSYYDWRGGKPFSVQRATCAMLTTNNRAYVLNDMGTGKTKAALWAWDYLRSNKCAGKLLVVAPLSTLSFVWMREVFATLPHRKAVVLHGTKKKRLENLADETAEIFIVNHDGLKVISADLQARDDITALVIDELAVYRNNSQRSKLMRTFVNKFEWAWGMTGSPMPNNPTDVWAQCKILTPHTVPKYKRLAEEELMTRINNFILKPKPDAVHKAFSWMQPSVRYTLDDVTELPDMVERTIDVDLSSEQKHVYKKVANELQVLVKEKVVTAQNAAVAVGKLLQIGCGWVYSKSPEFVTLDASPRIDALLDLIESAQRKVIVCVPFRHAIDGLADRFAKEGIDYAMVHGQVSGRDQIFNLFQNSDKYKVLLAHPQCVSHGLTLTAADTTIWYCPIASLEIYSQMNARIRRVGQKHKQQFLHLQATPVEKKLYALLRAKQTIQDKLLDMFEEQTAAGF